MPMEAGMMCNTHGETFYSFTKNTWIDNSCTSCHITNNDSGLFDVTKISESIQRSSGSMPVRKKGKLCINVQKVDGTEWVHILFSPLQMQTCFP